MCLVSCLDLGQNSNISKVQNGKEKVEEKKNFFLEIFLDYFLLRGNIFTLNKTLSWSCLAKLKLILSLLFMSFLFVPPECKMLASLLNCFIHSIPFLLINVHIYINLFRSSSFHQSDTNISVCYRIGKSEATIMEKMLGTLCLISREKVTLSAPKAMLIQVMFISEAYAGSPTLINMG